MTRELTFAESMWLAWLRITLSEKGKSEAEIEQIVQGILAEAFKEKPRAIPAPPRWKRTPPTTREWKTGFHPLDHYLERLDRRNPRVATLLRSCDGVMVFFRLLEVCFGVKKSDVYRLRHASIRDALTKLIDQQVEEYGAWRCGHPKVPENCKPDGPRFGMRCRLCREASNRNWERGNGQNTRYRYRNTFHGINTIRSQRSLRTASGSGKEASRRYRERKKAGDARIWSDAPRRVYGQEFYGKFYPFPGQED